MLYFSQKTGKIQPNYNNKRIKSINVNVIVQDCTGNLYITDMQLQGGSSKTGWIGHPSEKQWVLDD